MKTVLVKVACAEFRKHVAMRDDCFDPATVDSFVVPIEAFAIPGEGGLSVGHKCGPGESLCDDSLREIALANDVAALNRRDVTYCSPRRSGETACFVRYRLPAKPILRVQDESAALETLEAILIGIGRTNTHNPGAEELIQLHSDPRLNLVIPVITFGVENQPQLHIRCQGYGTGIACQYR